MKKTFIVLAFMLLCAMANAQMTYHVVYIPGVGEQQSGINFAPSFDVQHLGVNADGVDAVTNNPFSYDVDGSLSNNIGINFSLFYGYETVDRTINWGNNVSLAYSANPFSGEVTLSHNGVVEKHDVGVLVQQFKLRFHPFLSYRIKDNISVSAGLGITFSPIQLGKVKLDGQVVEKPSDAEATILSALFNSYLDANVGVKYWFSDELFAGFGVRYAFANTLDIFGSLSSEEENVLENTNGAVNLNMSEGTGRYTILPKHPVQAVFTVGFAW